MINKTITRSLSHWFVFDTRPTVQFVIVNVWVSSGTRMDQQQITHPQHSIQSNRFGFSTDKVQHWLRRKPFHLVSKSTFLGMPKPIPRFPCRAMCSHVFTCLLAAYDAVVLSINKSVTHKINLLKADLAKESESKVFTVPDWVGCRWWTMDGRRCAGTDRLPVISSFSFR